MVRLRVRAWPFEQPLVRQPYMTDRDARLRWRLRPSEDRNSLGLKNPEIGDKPPGALRAIILGDSLVYGGKTTEAKKQFTVVVQARLNRTRTSSRTIELINAGVPGYTTYQELEFLKTYGLEWEPDVVVLGVVVNDPYYKYLHRPVHELNLPAEPKARRFRFDPQRSPAILSKSYLAHDVVHALEHVQAAVGLKKLYPFEVRWDTYLSWQPHGWRHTDRLIGEMKALLAERGARLYIMFYPVVDQVKDENFAADPDRVHFPQQRLREICDKHGLEMLDLTEPLHEAGGEALFVDYFHLDHPGNDVVADELTRWFEEAILPDLDH